eukprot:Gb_37985 [translate_table: standard]
MGFYYDSMGTTSEHICTGISSIKRWQEFAVDHHEKKGKKPAFKELENNESTIDPTKEEEDSEGMKDSGYVAYPRFCHQLKPIEEMRIRGIPKNAKDEGIGGKLVTTSLIEVETPEGSHATSPLPNELEDIEEEMCLGGDPKAGAEAFLN